jgi:cystathionine gamma-synthase
MPTLRDLVGYESNDPETHQKIRTGYPRFHIHPYVSQVQEHLREKFGIGDVPLLTVSSRKAAEALCEFSNIDETYLREWDEIFFVTLSGDELKRKRAKAFLQHTGSGISTRQAEDILIKEGILKNAQAEEYFVGDDPETHIRETLRIAYGANDINDIYLTSFGMNSVYSVYHALNSLLFSQNKKIWIQFGWLFMDTMKIVDKFKNGRLINEVIYNVFDLDKLETILSEKGEQVVGIITEAPSNPLLRTPDVGRLRHLADKYGCALAIDVTLGTPYNVDVLPYADVIMESLTKYANGAADLMMGAIVLNSHSHFYFALKERLSNCIEKPYSREVKRLAFQISGYADRMKKVNANTIALVDFLKTREWVKKIFWSYEEESRCNFEKIQKAPNSPGGLITLEIQKPLASVYDHLKIAKGPSLGAEFTLVGPYLYHAHYDLVSTQEGRKFLHKNGLNPELLRISVGVEDIEDIIGVFSKVF